jgi:hypothetical protein
MPFRRAHDREFDGRDRNTHWTEVMSSDSHFYAGLNLNWRAASSAAFSSVGLGEETILGSRVVSSRLMMVEITSTPRMGRSGGWGGTKKVDSKANFFQLLALYFNSSSRLVRKRRSGSCRARASAFSYEARASGIRPNLRHRSARAECAK